MANISDKLIFKKEIILDINQFNEINTERDLIALAINVQTLLLTSPNTYPSTPYMGIGINSFKFEYSDADSLNELTTRINQQVSDYIGSREVKRIVVEFLKHKDTGFYSLGVMVVIGEEREFVITIDRERSTGKIYSKIYV